MSPAESLFAFWRHAEKRSEKPKPVWVAVAGDGKILTWSVNRRDAESKGFAVAWGPVRIVNMRPYPAELL